MIGRLPRGAPAGEAIRPRLAADWRRVASEARGLPGALATRLGVERVDLYGSGRESLRRALLGLRNPDARDEVVVPAYTCFSVPAAVVAAGFKVRLVDVDDAARIDPDHLARLPLDRALALVVCNLLGRAEALASLRTICADAGVALIDDAAQAFGARNAEGAAGGRGDIGILSFGRGKPLAGLGGGAIAWRQAPAVSGESSVPAAGVTRAWIRTLAHDLALSPWVFPWLAAIPALEIGRNHFDPEFPRAPMPGEARTLIAAQLGGYDEHCTRRQGRVETLAREIAAETPCQPLVAGSDETAGYARLGVLARDGAHRDAVLAALARRGIGGSAFYAASLGDLAGLTPHRAGDDRGELRGARDLAARLFTLPVTFSRSRAILDALGEGR